MKKCTQKLAIAEEALAQPLNDQVTASSKELKNTSKDMRSANKNSYPKKLLREASRRQAHKTQSFKTFKQL